MWSHAPLDPAVAEVDGLEPPSSEKRLHGDVFRISRNPAAPSRRWACPRTFRRPSGSRRPSYCARRPPEVPGFDHSERLAALPAPLHPVLDDLVLALELGLLLPRPRACLLLESRRRSRDHRGALAFFPLPALPPVSRADASRWVAVNDPEGLVFVVCLPVSRPDESWCWVLVPEPLPVRVSPLPATRPLASR